MPIYLYKCASCQIETEKYQSMGAMPPPCPDCGKEMERKPTYPAVVKIKGMGGYPYRRKKIHGTAPYSGVK